MASVRTGKRQRGDRAHVGNADDQIVHRELRHRRVVQLRMVAPEGQDIGPGDADDIAVDVEEVGEDEDQAAEDQKLLGGEDAAARARLEFRACDRSLLRSPHS